MRHFAFVLALGSVIVIASRIAAAQPPPEKGADGEWLAGENPNEDHTGLRVSYRLAPKLKLGGVLVNSWNSFTDNNRPRPSTTGPTRS